MTDLDEAVARYEAAALIAAEQSARVERAEAELRTVNRLLDAANQSAGMHAERANKAEAERGDWKVMHQAAAQELARCREGYALLYEALDGQHEALVRYQADLARLKDANRVLTDHVREAAGDEFVLLPITTVEQFSETEAHKLRVRLGETSAAADILREGLRKAQLEVKRLEDELQIQRRAQEQTYIRAQRAEERLAKLQDLEAEISHLEKVWKEAAWKEAEGD